MWLRLAMVVTIFFAASVQASECLDAGRLKALDLQYEEALRVGDTGFLNNLLADDFVWVHNLASEIEGKSVLLARLKAPQDIAKARTSHDVSVHRLADTAVLSGLSSVDKFNPDGKTFRTDRYRFMRTYVAVDKKCRLLSVQTMKVWSSNAENPRD